MFQVSREFTSVHRAAVSAPSSYLGNTRTIRHTWPGAVCSKSQIQATGGTGKFEQASNQTDTHTTHNIHTHQARAYNHAGLFTILPQ